MKRVTRYQCSIFESADELNLKSAEFLISLAKKTIAEKGKFVIVLSGGETPQKFYSLLAQTPYKEQLDWKNIFVFWGDERCVPSYDERNNAHQAKVLLFDKVDIPLTNIHPIPVNVFPEQAAEEYEKKLKLFFGDQPIQFDLVLLGLGEDGHTASLFPETTVLNEKKQGMREVSSKYEHIYRITMTAPLINQAKNVLFLVTGKSKAEILNIIVNGQYDPENYPAQLINPKDGNLFLFADRYAALLSGIQNDES